MLTEHSSPAEETHPSIYISLNKMQGLVSAGVHTLTLYLPAPLRRERDKERATGKKKPSLLQPKVSNNLQTSIYITALIYFFLLVFSNIISLYRYSFIHNHLNIQQVHTLQTKFSRQWKYKSHKMHHTYTE